MIVDPDQEYWIWYKKWWSHPSGSASGAILEWGGSEFYELSCWIILVRQVAQISYMIKWSPAFPANIRLG